MCSRTILNELLYVISEITQPQKTFINTRVITLLKNHIKLTKNYKCTGISYAGKIFIPLKTTNYSINIDILHTTLNNEGDILIKLINNYNVLEDDLKFYIKKVVTYSCSTSDVIALTPPNFKNFILNISETIFDYQKYTTLSSKEINEFKEKHNEYYIKLQKYLFSRILFK